MFAADTIAGGITVWVGGSLIAAFILAALVALRKPTRWLWRQIVTDPLGDWFDRVVTNAVEKSPTSNAVGALTIQVDHLVREIEPTNGDRRSISDRLDTTKGIAIDLQNRVVSLEESHSAIKKTLAKIGTDNPSRGLVDDHLNEGGITNEG